MDARAALACAGRANLCASDWLDARRAYLIWPAKLGPGSAAKNFTQNDGQTSMWRLAWARVSVGARPAAYLGRMLNECARVWLLVGARWWRARRLRAPARGRAH